MAVHPWLTDTGKPDTTTAAQTSTSAAHLSRACCWPAPSFLAESFITSQIHWFLSLVWGFAMNLSVLVIQKNQRFSTDYIITIKASGFRKVGQSWIFWLLRRCGERQVLGCDQLLWVHSSCLGNCLVTDCSWGCQFFPLAWMLTDREVISHFVSLSVSVILDFALFNEVSYYHIWSSMLVRLKLPQQILYIHIHLQ